MSLPIYYYRYFTIKGSRFFVSLRKSDRRPSRSKVDLYGEKKTKLWLKLNGKLWQETIPNKHSQKVVKYGF